jgi:hypothetical protein
MWDLNFGTWISHRGFTVAFGHGHPLVYNYNMCVRPSDGIVSCFNGLAELAQTVGFRKWEPAWTVGIRKREPRSWWLMRRVVREDQETEILRRVSVATEQIQQWFFGWFFWWLSLSGSLRAAETSPNPGFRDLDGQDLGQDLFFFFFLVCRPKLPSSTDRVFFFFFLRPKLPSSTDIIFFFFFTVS